MPALSISKLLYSLRLCNEDFLETSPPLMLAIALPFCNAVASAKNHDVKSPTSNALTSKENPVGMKTKATDSTLQKPNVNWTKLVKPPNSQQWSRKWILWEEKYKLRPHKLKLPEWRSRRAHSLTLSSERSYWDGQLQGRGSQFSLMVQLLEGWSPSAEGHTSKNIQAASTVGDGFKNMGKVTWLIREGKKSGSGRLGESGINIIKIHCVFKELIKIQFRHI